MSKRDITITIAVLASGVLFLFGALCGMHWAWRTDENRLATWKKENEKPVYIPLVNFADDCRNENEMNGEDAR